MEVGMDVAGRRLATEALILTKAEKCSESVKGQGGDENAFDLDRDRRIAAIKHVIATGEMCREILPRKGK
jgi:hypothetical protein